MLLKGTVQPTKGWLDSIAVDLGVVSLQAGAVRVELAAIHLKNRNVFMDVNTIRLAPVGCGQ